MGHNGGDKLQAESGRGRWMRFWFLSSVYDSLLHSLKFSVHFVCGRHNVIHTQRRNWKRLQQMHHPRVRLRFLLCLLVSLDQNRMRTGCLFFHRCLQFVVFFSQSVQSSPSLLFFCSPPEFRTFSNVFCRANIQRTPKTLSFLLSPCVSP